MHMFYHPSWIWTGLSYRQRDLTWLLSLARCADQGEGLPQAGERAAWALQHHLMCHIGWDPALPPHQGSWLPWPDAAAPGRSDRLLPEDHGQAARCAAEIRWGAVGAMRDFLLLLLCRPLLPPPQLTFWPLDFNCLDKHVAMLRAAARLWQDVSLIQEPENNSSAFLPQWLGNVSPWWLTAVVKLIGFFIIDL